MFGPKRNRKPLPPWLGVLVGLLFIAMGAFFLLGMIFGERAPNVSIIAIMIAFLIAIGVLAGGLLVLVESVRRRR